MSSIPAILQASLEPQTRQVAEKQLEELSSQPGFVILLIQIVLDNIQTPQARQAAAVYFKNTIKRRWSDKDTDEPIPPTDKSALRAQLLQAMIALSSPSDKLLRSQISEAVAAIATVDYPHDWPDLIDQITSLLVPGSHNQNLSLLLTAHSIFLPWRSSIRTDSLYSTINNVLSRFDAPFFALLRTTASSLLDPANPPSSQDISVIAECMALLLAIYFDLTSQDLPPMVEDSFPEFFGIEGGDEGWFIKFLRWDPPQLRGDPEDIVPTAPLRIRQQILEILELFFLRYNDISNPRLPSFVRAVGELIGASPPPSSPASLREDAVVAQAIGLLSVAVKTGLHTNTFKEPETLRGLCASIIVPNMAIREHEVEQFEDDPLEYIRRDLSIEGGQTRRHASAELIRSLISVGLEVEVTTIVQNYVAAGLQEYATSPGDHWRAKDSAISLITALASRGSATSVTLQGGISSTNLLVDIIAFFSQHVAADLQSGSVVHPILQVDAIRFLYTFRYQLTKAQLIAVLPLLRQHLSSEQYVCYTYAAITIERILFIKHGNQMLFSQAAIHDFAVELLTALFTKIDISGSPEKVAENDYIMKCVMRVIITARQTLTPVFQTVLERLVSILLVISKNPSNPNFSQFCFESISGLLRFTVAGNPQTITNFENLLFPPFTAILQNDIDQFIPYVFQLVSQMLEAHATGFPDTYRALLPHLLTPAVWQPRGSVPPLVRLIKAYVSKDAKAMEANGQIRTVLAITQQKLIPSKINDSYGFDLLKVVFTALPRADMVKYSKDILTSLFIRLQGSKTEKFVDGLLLFFCYLMAIKSEDVDADVVVVNVESIQPGLWSSLLANVILPQAGKVQPRDRKLVIIGLTRLLARSHSMLTEPSVSTWPTVLNVLLQLALSSDIPTKRDQPSDADDAIVTQLDYEESTAGYQASYSRLAASEPTSVDPVAYVPDARLFLKEALADLARRDGRVNALISRADQSLVQRLGQA